MSDGVEVGWHPSVKKERGDWEQIAESLGGLYTRGVKINWEGWEKGMRKRVNLPTYAFQRKRYWVEGVEFGANGSKEKRVRCPSEWRIGCMRSSGKKASEKEKAVSNPAVTWLIFADQEKKLASH